MKEVQFKRHIFSVNDILAEKIEELQAELSHYETAAEVVKEWEESKLKQIQQLQAEIQDLKEQQGSDWKFGEITKTRAEIKRLKIDNEMLWKAVEEIKVTYPIRCSGLKAGELVACRLHEEIIKGLVPTVAEPKGLLTERTEQ
jgi:hypothetical protein